MIQEMTEAAVGPSRPAVKLLSAAPAPVLLSELASQLKDAELRGDATITGICSDSRRVRPGDLFLAISGDHTDGHRFGAQALFKGASALVVERFLDLEVAQLRLPSVAKAAGLLSARLYGSPSDALMVIGVTGTNGKTTTCQLLQACLAWPDGVAGQIGTTGTYLGGKRLATSSLSTPEAPELQRYLATMLEAGARGVAMEVTSHGLDRHRVEGTRFRVGVFLNLSPEHLDYHGSMERYFKAKRRLFEPERCKEAVICVDSAWGERLAGTAAIPTVTFGHGPHAQIRLRCRSLGLEGILVELVSGKERTVLTSPLIGTVNAPNVAAAYLAAVAIGIDPEVAKQAIAACPPPPGRFELVSNDEPFLAVVDYAHTPDALEALVSTARLLAGDGRVRIVLGARGERYAAKRPEMAKAASVADEIVLTTDSPGNEDAARIVEEMLAGVPVDRRRRFAVELDRETAIRRAVASLAPADVLLVTGRGHETTQRFGDRLVPFDDRVAVRLALAARPEASRPLAGDPLAVSVVIPAHDAADTLGDAIDSVLAQTRPVEEIIVVDDGSVDATGEVARSFGDKVRLLEQARLGPSAARNAGVAACRAPLVAFLDADDLWGADKLERQVDALARTGAVLCATDWVRARPATSSPPSRLSAISTDDLLVLNRFQTSTVVVRRDAFARAGGFSSRLDGAEDWDLWIRLSRLGPVVKLDAPLVCYQDRPEGFSKDLRRHHDAVLEIVRRELASASSARSRELQAWHHLRFAVAFLRLGDRRRAMACIATLARERLVGAAVPATMNLLLPFLAGRARRRLASSRNRG
jgi:UDP-N-acetylmuramoyl-L-alanyl-D-glutamate--2,6-diaminopimelate ligase